MLTSKIYAECKYDKDDDLIVERFLTQKEYKESPHKYMMHPVTPMALESLKEIDNEIT